MQIFVICILIGGLLLFFITGFILNRKTPMPEGIDLPSLNCANCNSVSCSFAGTKTAKAMKQEIKQELKNENERM